jgi:hypothetical protein
MAASVLLFIRNSDTANQVEGFKMRDLSTDELGHVYGAGGRGRHCSPRPPSCGGSKSRKSKSKKSKSKKSKSKRSRGRRYC